jgi:hypothetical protein
VQQQRSAAQLFDMTPDVCQLFDGSAPRVEKVLSLLGYKKKDLAEATNVPFGSIRYDNRMPSELRERITEWAIAINRVAVFFKDQEKTMLWFKAPNPLLGEISPRDMIRQGRFRKLLKFIDNALAENVR